MHDAAYADEMRINGLVPKPQLFDFRVRAKRQRDSMYVCVFHGSYTHMFLVIITENFVFKDYSQCRLNGTFF